MLKTLKLAVIALVTSCTVATAGPFEIEFTEVADDVWVGVRPDGPRFPVMGSTTFAISESGVVVFDGGGLPVMAEKIIDQIRSLTGAPVTHVVVSHWHGDHNFGIHRFVEEYPNVQIVAHEFTREVMTASRIRYVDDYPTFIARNLPSFEAALEGDAAEGGTPLSETDRIEYQRIVDHAEEIDREYKRARVTVPTVVFTDRLTIYSGSRRIDLIKLGHGNTEGDIVMWLPEEKVVAAGDLVVMPTPYAFNVPPRPWALSGYYHAYFERPFRLAAVKALSGERMVPVEREAN